MLLSLIGIFQTKIDTSFSLFAPGRSSYEQGSELMKEMFGDTNQMLVLIPGKEEPDDIRRTASLIGDLSDTDGISMAIGPVPADMAAASDESINAYVAALPTNGLYRS
jgi:predicted RND superfamily exporter protein